MSLRNVKNALDILNKSPYFIKENHQKEWQKFFKNKNPICIEIGCGKGNFLINMAKTYPNINFIGIEKYESVLVRAIEKVNEENLNNLYFICIDALKIDDYFDHEIDTIYLNFSDPWPKKRHEKRRLTSSVFLNKYDKVFKGIKVIEQKTDNDDLFNYSIESFKAHRYFIIKKNTNYFDKIKTEYEEKFIRKGKNINYVKVIKF